MKEDLQSDVLLPPLPHLAVLLFIIFAIGDSGNAPPTEGTSPFVLLWLVTGIGATLGWQTAYAVNVIRDWGPRIALTIVGYKGLWSFEDGYFAYTPMASVLCGNLFGAFVYDTFIYTGGESWLNKRWSWNRPKAAPMSKEKMPMAIDK
jgi:aquaglyceroporin related protein